LKGRRKKQPRTIYEQQMLLNLFKNLHISFWHSAKKRRGDLLELKSGFDNSLALAPRSPGIFIKFKSTLNRADGETICGELVSIGVQTFETVYDRVEGVQL
jgi:hypothetical protein